MTRAAELCGVTQSSMSITLKQCREIYQDKLLVRDSHGKMLLTPFAEKLQTHIQQTRLDIDKTLALRASFDPQSSTRTFHLGMSDHLALIVLPSLLNTCSSNAPSIKIIHHAINHLESYQPFTQDGLDIAIGHFKHLPSSLKNTRLFEDKGVIVADKTHPLMQQAVITPEQFCQYPQIFVALESRPDENFIEAMLKKQGYDLQTILITPHTLLPFHMLPGTNFVTNTVEKLAQRYLEPLKLLMRPANYDLPPYEARMVWTEQLHTDPAHIWLRNEIKAIFSEKKRSKVSRDKGD